MKKQRVKRSKPKSCARGGYRGKRDDAGVAEPTTWHSVLMKRKAQIATLELRKREGELVELDEVLRANRATAAMIQTDVTGLGRRLAPVLVGRDIADIQAEIDKATRDMLESWRKYPTSAFNAGA